VSLPSETKPAIDLKPYEPRAITDIASGLGLLEDSVEIMLRKSAREHTRLFGTRPYELIYDPMLGEVIRANSTIGYVQTDGFLLRLQPCVKGLEIGKCVGLAQKCGFGFLSRYRNEILRQNLSDRESYSTIEFFAQSFMAAVTTIVANGLDRRFTEETVEAVKLGGNVKIQESVRAGKIKSKPLVGDIVSDYNTPPNRCIVTALEVCRDQCRSNALVRWARSLMDSFPGVVPYGSSTDLESVPSSQFSTPRADYEHALLLVRLILEGSLWKGGSTPGFLPLFTMDLDKLFEQYVSVMLDQTLKPDKFKVELQKEKQHPTRPRVRWKSFVPDIVIRPIQDRPIAILDVKNKYQWAVRQEAGYVSNEDLFQIAYYCHALDARFGFLVFPGSTREITKYPLKGSEGTSAYEAKRTRAFRQICNDNKITIFPGRVGAEIHLFKWVIDLTGTMRDSAASVASLAQFIADVLGGKERVA